MLGSIEDLEKDIELFQQNVAASGEVTKLLQQMVEQIKAQNAELESQSMALVSRMDALPGNIENANVANNLKIKSDVASEMESAVRKFSDEQSKYITAMTDTREKINSLAEQLKQQDDLSSSRISTLLNKVDSVLNQMVSNLETANTKLKKEVEQIVDDRNAQFLKEQSSYISEVQQTQNNMKKCEEQLSAKYQEFIETLEKMNISNLHDQNVELKKELNKRTTILMVISILSVIVGVVGILL